MPKIIKDGVSYNTAPSTASGLPYNNSTSGLSSSNVQGAIDELAQGGGTPWTDVTGTLSSGSTSITLSDSAITTSSTIEVFNDLDIPYNSKTLTTGSIILTFDAQQSNMTVMVRVS